MYIHLLWVIWYSHSSCWRSWLQCTGDGSIVVAERVFGKEALMKMWRKNRTNEECRSDWSEDGELRYYLALGIWRWFGYNVDVICRGSFLWTQFLCGFWEGTVEMVPARLRALTHALCQSLQNDSKGVEMVPARLRALTLGIDCFSNL